jgi:hypothetical protein
MLDGEIKLDQATTKVLSDFRLEEWGIGSTQYTRAARLAAAQELITTTILPITLTQARDAFSPK